MSGKAAHIRTLAFIGHSGCGKTSVAEALLFAAGATTRLGKVDDGSSVLDFEPEEIKRKITISSAFHHYTWKKHTVYLADTPGDDNFLADTRAVLHVVDGAVGALADATVELGEAVRNPASGRIRIYVAVALGCVVVGVAGTIAVVLAT
uniref:Tr-type G domain-containing protein n=1 Tax=Desulfobacca acetoxidans TaxID=60893 RepID=A0A7V4G8F7_9BACT